MATTTSLTTTFAGKEAGAYIKSAFYANETLKYITVKENIDYKQVVRKLVDTITFADDTCDFTPTGTVTLTERILTWRNSKYTASFAKTISLLTGAQSKSKTTTCTLH